MRARYAGIIGVVAALMVAGVGQTALCGETLCNGIVLPDNWPPRADPKYQPMPVPYLDRKNIPAVIPIDVGRQLFVDDFLIESTTNLVRTYHRADYHPANPILKPDRPWETFQARDWEKVGDTPASDEHRKLRLYNRRRPTACAFSDGVWWDPQEQIFKLWYMGGFNKSTCYATSHDGIHWQKPLLDVEPGTNIVLRHNRDSATIWLDRNETDPSRRYKMFVTEEHPAWTIDYALVVRFSPDGIHWSKPLTPPQHLGDRTTVFYNPFRQVWAFSIRSAHGGIGRDRSYREHTDILAPWDSALTVFWTGADPLDPRNPDPRLRHIQPELYNLDCMAYESLLLGQFCIWQGEEPAPPGGRPNPKRNQIFLGFSRDGFHWYRPDRRPFMGCNSQDPKAWNWGNVQSVGGGCLVLGDKLHFHCSGWSKAHDPKDPLPVLSTGLATLRRDGFASMDAGDVSGTLTTRPVCFRGKHLFVNIDSGSGGQLRVVALDKQGKPIEPFTLDACLPLTADKTLLQVKWAGGSDLSRLAGQAVRFRFHLRNAKLYAFWISPRASGASYGYVAAGGPGLTGDRDTVGAEGASASRSMAER